MDSGFKAGFSKCMEEICHFVEKEPTLSISQKNKLLSHLTNITSIIPLVPEHVNSSIDDAASSYSGNSSRSNTPSSAVNDTASMEYLPCSPYSDCTQEGSSNSSPPSTTRNAAPSKNFSSQTLFSTNLSSGNRSPNRLPASGSNVGVMEADSTSYNINRPLNLASSSRTVEKNAASHGQYTNSTGNRILLSNEYARGIHERREVAMDNHDTTGRYVYGNDIPVHDAVLMQIDPVWRPW